MNEAFLHQLELELSKLQPMELLPTGVLPSYRRMKSVEAIVFDVYGTLLLSASGDVMRAGFNPKAFKQVLDACGIVQLVPEPELASLQTIFDEVVYQAKAMARAGGIRFPELDVAEQWRKALMRAQEQRLLDGVEQADVRLYSFLFELSRNQLWPMPGLCETVSGLKQKGYPLGIISNAQFYTPVLLNYFLSGSLAATGQVAGFDPDLCVYSYKLQKAKPDPALCETLLKPLRMRGLETNQVLFVGNDMLKDIYPAQQVGFKTCFFAGDRRAYQHRSDHPQASKVKPDMVITDLRQLLEVL